MKNETGLQNGNRLASLGWRSLTATVKRLHLSVILFVTLVAASNGQMTIRASVSSSGGQADNGGYASCVSADGRFVAFNSNATTLGAGTSNGFTQVFVRDMVTGQVTCQSVSAANALANGDCGAPVISADGRFVAFHSDASNLVSNDTNGRIDVFVRDRTTSQNICASASLFDGTSPAISADGRYVAFTSDDHGVQVHVYDRLSGSTRMVSITSSGQPGDGASYGASISGDGRMIAFHSTSKNFIPNDITPYEDVYVHDCQTGSTILASVSSSGEQGSGGGSGIEPSISADGRYVTFLSNASNLVEGDTNDYHIYDVFVHDLQTGETTLADVTSMGVQANGDCQGRPSISADGRYVAFQSLATNLVPGGLLPGDVYVHDRQSGLTTCGSLTNAGLRGNLPSTSPCLSADGRFVTFDSRATNLVLGDTNNNTDVFVREFDNPSYAVMNVNSSPSTIRGGLSATGSVTLTHSAPTEGAIISLISSNSSLVSIPAFVRVPSGSSSATFPIVTDGVDSDTVVSISAIGGGNTVSAGVTLQRAIPLLVSTTSGSIVGGNQMSGAVTLDGNAGPSPATVQLSFDNAAVSLSPTCEVPANQKVGTFLIQTSGVASPTVVTLMATYNSVSKTRKITVLPASPSSIVLSPTTVVGGASSVAKITLNGVAPVGGLVVTLGDNSSAVQTPPSITVPWGANFVTVSLPTTPVTSSIFVTVSATANSVTKSANLGVTAPALSSVSVSPAAVLGGGITVGTVKLNGATASGGAVVSLSSDNVAAFCPPSVLVASGASTANFNIATKSVNANTPVTITASRAGVDRTATLTVIAPVLINLAISPSAVTGGFSATGTASLNGPAPTGGATVALSSNWASIASVPASVFIPAGWISANFNVTTVPVVADLTVTILAKRNVSTRTATILVKRPVLLSLTLSAGTVVGGQSITGRVTLSGPARVGTSGITVTLSSDSPAVAGVPISVTVPAGATSATFTVTTFAVGANTTVTISGEAGVVKTQTLLVTT